MVLGVANQPRVTARLRRWGLGAAIVVGSSIGAMGVLHTSWGAPLLARLGGCPAMRLSAVQADELHRRGIGGLRGRAPAPARPALGFALDRTTLADAHAWAARVLVACTVKQRGFVSLQCVNVPRAALPDARQDPATSARVGAPSDSPVIGELLLVFDAGNRLIAVDAFTRHLVADSASGAFASSEKRLHEMLGPASDTGGEGVTPALIAAPLATAVRRYRFSDYIAILTVSNLASGLAVREQYLSGT